MLKKMTAIIVGSLLMIQGVVMSPTYTQGEQYQYERTKVNYSALEVEIGENRSEFFMGRYDACKSQIFDAIEKKMGVTGFKTYSIDQNSGKIIGVTMRSLRDENLLNSQVIYRYKNDLVMTKYEFSVLETSGSGGIYYMRSAPFDNVDNTGGQTEVITSSAAILLEPNALSMQNRRPLPPSPIKPKNDKCELKCTISEISVTSSLSPNKEMIIAGANDYPLDGILNGYYYKRLCEVITIPPPVIKEIQTKQDVNKISLSIISGNKNMDLDPNPYQVTINNITSEWFAQPYYEAVGLQANTNYTITVRLKGLKGQIVEKTITEMTLAEKPNLEVSIVTAKDTSLRIIDQNPPNTKYQIKFGMKYVLENGQMSSTEQWIKVPTKQIKVMERLSLPEMKLSIKAINDKNIPTIETAILSERYRYERCKASYVLQESNQLNSEVQIFNGHFEVCKEEIFEFVKNNFVYSGYTTYGFDQTTGTLNGVTPYTMTISDIKNGGVLYIKKTDQSYYKYKFSTIELTNNSNQPMRFSKVDEISNQNFALTSSSALQTDPGLLSTMSLAKEFITDPSDPVYGHKTVLDVQITEIMSALKLDDNKEIVIAGAEDFPKDGVLNGYYYKRLSTIRNVPLPEINDVQINVGVSTLNVTVVSNNLIADLDSKPYQFVVNGSMQEWQASSTCKINNQSISPNSRNSVVVRLKNLNNQIVERNTDITTLADNPSIKISKISNKDTDLTITDKNPPQTEYQICVGNQFVLQNGYLSDREQWITIPTKQIKIMERINFENQKIIIRARNEEKIPTRVIGADVTQAALMDMINSTKTLEGTYSIKLVIASPYFSKLANKVPYQFVINGQATEWSILPYYTFANLQPNTDYSLIVRVRDQNGTIYEFKTIKKTLPQEQTSTYKYDDVSALLEIEQSESKDMFTYDSFGNLIKENFTTK